MKSSITYSNARKRIAETVDFLSQFAYKPANFPPGQGCRYCNCSYVLLGLLIEKVSGLDINVVILANIINGAWEPRKMIHGLLIM